MSKTTSPASGGHTASARLRSRLKLRQVILLVALSEHRSLRKAASVIAVSQPAATKLLHELEDALGVPLFERHAWGVEPTLYGDSMIRYARGVLTGLSEVGDEVSALRKGSAGLLRVGGVTGSVPMLLTPTLAQLRVAQPDLQVSLLVNASEMLWAALRQGTLEVIIATAPKPNDLHDLTCEALDDEPLCLVARAGHPLSRQKSIAPASLERARWILQPPETPMRQSIDALFSHYRLRLPANLIETVSIVATLSLLQAEDALSVLPMALAAHYESHGLLARLPIALPPRSSPYELIVRSNRPLSPAALLFMAEARRVAKARRASGRAGPHTKRR